MTPTILVGPETTIQNVDNNLRDVEFGVHELEPNVAPLTVLSRAMGTVAAINPKFEWEEDELLPRITTLSTSAQSAATSAVYVPVLDIWRVGDVFRFSSLGFGGLITATAANSITATIIGTSGLSAQSGSEMFLVSNANAELATMRELKFTQLNVPYNYDQIIRTPFGVSTTEIGTKHYGGPERDRLAKHFGIDHARALEQTFFFGIRSITSTTRTAGGLQQYVTTNVTNDSGGTTLAEWETFLVTAFRYGSRRKTAFCSPKAIQALEGFARSNLRAVNADNNGVYGLKMRTYMSGQGEVDIISHVDWQDSAIYGGYLFLVDMDNVKERPLQMVGSTRLLRDRQAPDYDGVKDEYRSETGLQVDLERTHAIMTGMTGANV